MLELICKNFYHTLKELVPPEDCRLLFDTAQVRNWERRKEAQQVKVCVHSMLTSFPPWYCPSCYPLCSSSSPHQLLYPVHCNLLDDLERTMDRKHDSGRSDVTQYFLTHHTGLLHYGQYAVRLPLAVEKVSTTAVWVTWPGPALQLLTLFRPKCFRIVGRQHEHCSYASSPRSRGSLSVTSCMSPSRGSSNTLSS